MADATQGGTDIQYLGLLAPALIALIAGLVIHSFIIGVNVTDWLKGRTVTSFDHVVISLGISRMCAQSTNTLHYFMAKLSPIKLDLNVTLAIIKSFYYFFMCANIWLTSLFSIIFCLKISNFHSRLFLYLKRMIVQRTVYCIAVSVLLSALSYAISLSMFWPELTRGQTHNMTMVTKFIDCGKITFLYNYITGYLFPLLLYYISSVLLFTSLYHHTTKMKMSSNSSINLETYYSVMTCVSFTFTFNTICFIVALVCAFYYYVYCVNLYWLYIILDFLPVLHSSYLIYKTDKLRSQMSKVLQNVMDFLFQRKNTETRESIEVVTI
ncbi:hypothetical protein GDO78_022867 [Eleutherodactylus coqui]|uniref:Taste receptor type 2 n=1 Tax=Eleutherodactylus coqui TaxID=57060 RepID=A0A8J6JRG9_ELECQ|nr:hypothetical protein GDO78_022867 [Eleutherodactylus coqui]